MSYTEMPLGGYVYPVDSTMSQPETISDGTAQARGITLRAHFAGQIIQGMCAAGPGTEWTNARLAAEAVDMADALIIALESTQAPFR